MAGSFTRVESSHQGRPEALRSSQLPEIATTQVVLVMDGLEEFTIKPLKWALENISACGGINVTLPWLNIPFQKEYNPGLNCAILVSAKTWQGIREETWNSLQIIPCNLVMINENGEPVIIKMRPPTTGEFTSGESPASFIPSPL